jgi:ribosomal protein S18 acetylase RimI-like enzyme
MNIVVIRAKHSDKQLVVDILANSFADNKSVNYIIKQDKKEQQRVRSLMSYSFEVCMLYGDVFLSDDRTGCALIILPDKKKSNLKTTLLDLRLVFSATGLGNVNKAMSRESRIKAEHPKNLLYYLWFIGVDEAQQGKGVGSKLLQEIIQQGQSLQRTICLETSTLKNLPWYQKHGFEIYKEMDFGYPLYFLKRV